MKRLRLLGDRLWYGSITVARRRAAALAAWVRASPTPRGRGFRFAVLLIVGWIAVRTARAMPALLWVATAAWLWAAHRAGRGRIAAPAESPAEETPADTSEGSAEDAFRTLVWDAIGDRQGVHLRDLLAALHQAGMHPEWEVADVRSVCTRLGIPVRDRVRVRGRGVTVGVHRADLAPAEAPSGPSPESGPVETPGPGLRVA
ncbi:hypothetical protein [Streptomyces paromomycinus]|uniref:Uncharacterized protein n=1 Tax=Streptomyces paromomycinus TaxID=92743 RepID=A0A401WA08_STREY|nr:hypothetical protein [Streptomyces paromomycinus]GCD46130.1 hypothetical protein GKJPGBOP_05877 [Streptomyces paromomycinus]